MKILHVKSVFFTFILLVSFTACDSDDDNAANNDSKLQIEDNVAMGTWRITKYIDDGDDELDHLGHSFAQFPDFAPLAFQHPSTTEKFFRLLPRL